MRPSHHLHRALGGIRARHEGRPVPQTCDWPQSKGGCDNAPAYWNDTIERRVYTCPRHTPLYMRSNPLVE